MARRKLDKTLADYLAIAVTPALIMLLVGSLVWFLAEIGYTGSRESRVRWILFWFVIGAVLVARIAIEQGRAHASIFIFGLAGATSLAIFKFASDGPWVPIVCLGIVAWCADKLTWDCTLIDESEDASGEGLLQIAGVADEAELPQEQPDVASGAESESVASVDDGAESKNDARDAVPFWKRLFTNESERVGKPHAPGLWVVYFSLAALPIFGFGQTMIPATRADSRHFAFQCLLAYVGAGLGLLMLTSFLGLRRYLRQRNLEMPPTMAATWIGMGAAISVGILTVAMLLPRPQGDYSIAEAIDIAAEEIQEAADRAFLNDDGGQGEGQQSGPADEEADGGSASDPNQQGQPGGDQPGQQVVQNDQQNSENGTGGEQKGEGEDGKESGDQQGDGRESQGQGGGDQKMAQNEQSGGGEKQEGEQSSGGDKKDGPQTAQNQNSGEQQDGQPGDQPEDQTNDPQVAQNERDPDEENQNADAEESEETSEDELAQAEQPETPETETPPESDSSWMDSLFENAGTLFKWLVYAAMAAAVIYFAIRNWAAVVAFVRNLWTELLSMFGKKPGVAGEEAVDPDEPVAPPRPFAAFQDPFRSGTASKHSPAELVRYTFEALQAWAFENGCGRTPDQTPMEFGQQLRSRMPKISSEASEVSHLYAQVAYAGLRPTDSNMAVLQKLWRKLT